MNGRVPDEGAVSETAIAWTLGKPVVLFKEDVRSVICERDNPLLAGLAGFQICRELEQLAEVLDRSIAECETPRDWRVACPPKLAETLLEGERLWQAISTQDEEDSVEETASWVVELFGPGSRENKLV